MLEGIPASASNSLGSWHTENCCGRIGFCKRWASNTSGDRLVAEPARPQN